MATETGLAEVEVRLAVDYYGAFADEVNARLAADERAASSCAKPSPAGSDSPGRWLIDEMLPPDTAAELNRQATTPSI